ncbi:hypothetical protein MHYP_G00225300 [Metynnis hypsauchen]
MAPFSCRPLSTCVLDLFSRVEILCASADIWLHSSFWTRVPHRNTPPSPPPPLGQGSSLHAAISQWELILEERKCRQCRDQSSMSELKELQSEHGLTPGP